MIADKVHVVSCVCLFVCLGLRTKHPRDALRANDATRAIAAPILRTVGAMKKMHSIFAFGANSLLNKHKMTRSGENRMKLVDRRHLDSMSVAIVFPLIGSVPKDVEIFLLRNIAAKNLLRVTVSLKWSSNDKNMTQIFCNLRAS
jgi:hypothetical protein